MLTLTTPITVPNITRISVEGVTRQPKAPNLYVIVTVRGAGGIEYRDVELAITNGVCQGVRATASPAGFSDRVEVFSTTIAAGFTDALAQYRTGANDAAGRQNVETWLVANGLLPAGVVA